MPNLPPPFYASSRCPGYFQNQDIKLNMLEVIERKVHKVINDNITSSMESIFQHLRSVLNNFRNDIVPFLDFRMDLDRNYVIDDIEEIRIILRWMFEEGISEYEINYNINMKDVTAINPVFERRRGGLLNYYIEWEGIDWNDIRPQQVMTNATDPSTIEVDISTGIRDVLNRWREVMQHSLEEVQQQEEESNNLSNLPDHLFKIE